MKGRIGYMANSTPEVYLGFFTLLYGCFMYSYHIGCSSIISAELM